MRTYCVSVSLNIFVSVLIGFGGFACTSNQSSKPPYSKSSKKKQKKESKEDDKGEDLEIDECSDDTTLFLLGDEPTYHDEIKEFVDDNCTSCHRDDGTAEPDFTTFSQVEENAVKMLKRMQDEDEPMPPEGLPEERDVQIFEDWIDSGRKEGGKLGDDDDDMDEETDSCSRKVSKSDDEDTKNRSDKELDDSSDFDPIADLYDKAVNPPKLTECHGQGKLYDRLNDECFAASHPASYDCNEDGVVKAFGSSGPQARALIEQAKSEGFGIDQCGVHDNSPCVLFLCTALEDGTCVDKEALKESIKIRVKRLPTSCQ